MTPANDPSPATPPLPVDDLPLLTEVVDPSPAASAPPPAATLGPTAEAQLRWIERRLPQILAEEMALLETRVLTRLRLELEQGPPK
ncbi:hypothetical protein [Tepidiphilus succinatimandens]|uniref:hypothetical protein n=1 Tax=Tepidiphilus succinatimandens TaxID=224436 RepID=UPI00112F2B29|nr:hypothetical protein [Tepidiphilus succinatimandens]